MLILIKITPVSQKFGEFTKQSNVINHSFS